MRGNADIGEAGIEWGRWVDIARLDAEGLDALRLMLRPSVLWGLISLGLILQGSISLGLISLGSMLRGLIACA